VTVSVFVENRAGRKGVPLRRSFQQWIDAIPELRKRRAAEVAIVVVDADEGRDFNQRFRHRDYATNVLSFPTNACPAIAPACSATSSSARPSSPAKRANKARMRATTTRT
jgi:probable rRNA maturation factor